MSVRNSETSSTTALRIESMVKFLHKIDGDPGAKHGFAVAISMSFPTCKCHRGRLVPTNQCLVKIHENLFCRSNLGKNRAEPLNRNSARLDYWCSSAESGFAEDNFAVADGEGDSGEGG